MHKIKVLDPQEAIKIAAGEVVERPAHILKELVENSIDAGAKNITIYTKQAGKKEILITDDGSGMSPEDARICFLHHATSKINSVQDLDTVTTYGFRGEALSSIAAVTTVTLTTKTNDAKTAISLQLQDGKIVQESQTAHQTGTTIQVSDLFATIPARKKFLKSNDTEWNGLVSIFQAFCLRYTNIHFKMFHDGKLSYNCPATNDLTQRCAQLWTNNLHDQLIKIEKTEKQNITISGAISKSHYHRYNRNQIFIFINNRWVKNIEISRAILKGYQNVLPPQKYPAAFLYINLDQALIDVNIHPKKEEVKFLHPGIVQKIVQEIVTNHLNDALSKELHTKTNHNTPSSENIFKQPHQEALTKAFDMPFTTNIQDDTSAINSSTISPEKKVTNPLFENQDAHSKAAPTNQNQSVENIVSVEESNEKIYDETFFTIIGQFQATYILIEQEHKMIVVDQHAAHERILYEQFKKNFHDVATVNLLFPHIIKLSEKDSKTAQQHKELFKKHGIIFEHFSDTELIIQATPVNMQQKAVEEIIKSTIQLIEEQSFVDHEQLFKKINETIHAEKACKAACKAGDTLSKEQMQNIVQSLMKIDNRFCCPHGRPTMWNLTLKEIEKHFKRDYRSQKNSLLDFV